MKPKTKSCQNCKAKFSIEPADFTFYKKMDVPEPTFCPDCRLQRRFSFRNESKIYKRKCDFSGKEIFSMFSKDAPFTVYERNVWWSDKWDPLSYSKDYDFKKIFFEQFKELTEEIPWFSLSVQNMVNSDYSNQATELKNCYLVFGSGFSEDCAYGRGVNSSKDCYDNSYLEKCELCYQGFMLANCYKAFFSSHCDDCQEVIFSHSCVGCSNCFGCSNLRHKKYHIFNKPYTKEEYFKKLEEFNFGSYKNILSLDKKAKDFWLKYPVKFMHGRKNVNVTGEYIYNSKNVKDSFMIRGGENLKYCFNFLNKPSAKDCYDYSSWGVNARLIYENISTGNGISQSKFCYDCYPNNRDLEYCIQCGSSFNLFGCVGLRHKRYYILNKQYTKEEYNELVPQIKQHMNDMPYVDKKGRIYKYGEFFPTELSPFAYNETLAQEFFPLTKEQALKQGYTWYDNPNPEYKATIKAKDLSDNIKDVDNSILKEVIECANCHSRESGNPVSNNSGSPIKLGMTEGEVGMVSCAGSGVFRLIPAELKFYRKHNIPLPHLCPNCRHRERIKQRNPFKLWKRQCMNKGCNNTFQTTYSPDRKEIVYCEKCYNKEVN